MSTRYDISNCNSQNFELYGRRHFKPSPRAADAGTFDGTGDGIEKAKALAEAVSDFRFGIEEALDLGADGRIDEPETRNAANRLMNALNAALG